MKVSEILGISNNTPGCGSASDIRILLTHVLKKPSEFLIANPDFIVDEPVAQDFFSLVAKRRSGVPLAYLTNHREFFGLDFYVDERVLIPRPETELLVESVLKIARSMFKVKPTLRTPDATQTKEAGSQVSILDVGTGSGCIATSLAKNLPSARIIGVDISPDALEVAKKNASIHEVENRILFRRSDLLSQVPELVDVIVANLPYVGTQEKALVSKDVLDFEPKEALFAGPDGLDLFERLFQQIAAPCFIALEIGFSQKAALAKLIAKYFGNVEVLWKNDLAGLDRVCIINLAHASCGKD